MSMPAHNMHTKWHLTQPETPDEIVASPSDSYNKSLRNKGSNVIENEVDLYVNYSLQSNKFVNRHEEEEEKEEEEGAV